MKNKREAEMNIFRRLIFNYKFIKNLEYKYDNLKCCGNCKFKNFDEKYILICPNLNLPMNPEWVCQSWVNDWMTRKARTI